MDWLAAISKAPAIIIAKVSLDDIMFILADEEMYLEPVAFLQTVSK